jgi:hypothetical protein
LKFADFQCDSRKKSQNGEKDVDVKQKIDQQFKDWKSAGHAGMWIKKVVSEANYLLLCGPTWA